MIRYKIEKLTTGVVCVRFYTDIVYSYPLTSFHFTRLLKISFVSYIRDNNWESRHVCKTRNKLGINYIDNEPYYD